MPFVQTALMAARCSACSPALLGPLIVARKMAFAVHGTSELAFTGGAAALLVGINVGSARWPARSSRRWCWGCWADAAPNATR